MAAASPCEQLRRDSRRNTYKTGSYFTDDGDLEELDRDLVEWAKVRLQNGEMLQRPLDLFDKAPVQKITVQQGDRTGRRGGRGPKRHEEERGGGSWSRRGLVESARPPPPLVRTATSANGRRTFPDFAAAVELCATPLELEAAGTSKNNSSLGAKNNLF